MATTERKAGRASTEGNPDHFDKLLEGLCPNHAFPIKHMYKDCSLMKCFFTGGSKKWEQKKKPEAEADDAGEKDDGFPLLDGCVMIFMGQRHMAPSADRSTLAERSMKPSPPRLLFLNGQGHP